MKVPATNLIRLETTAIIANTFQDLFDFAEKTCQYQPGLFDLLEILTNVENWLCKFDMTKVPRAFSHSFTTGLTFEVSVDCAQPGV